MNANQLSISTLQPNSTLIIPKQNPRIEMSVELIIGVTLFLLTYIVIISIIKMCCFTSSNDNSIRTQRIYPIVV